MRISTRQAPEKIVKDLLHHFARWTSLPFKGATEEN
jgi:hypothetical protein